jgi:hypothetical protein
MKLRRVYILLYAALTAEFAGYFIWLWWLTRY